MQSLSIRCNHITLPALAAATGVAIYTWRKENLTTAIAVCAIASFVAYFTGFLNKSTEIGDLIHKWTINNQIIEVSRNKYGNYILQISKKIQRDFKLEKPNNVVYLDWLLSTQAEKEEAFFHRLRPIMISNKVFFVEPSIHYKNPICKHKKIKSFQGNIFDRDESRKEVEFFHHYDKIIFQIHLDKFNGERKTIQNEVHFDISLNFSLAEKIEYIKECKLVVSDTNYLTIAPKQTRIKWNYKRNEQKDLKEVVTNDHYEDSIEGYKVPTFGVPYYDTEVRLIQWANELIWEREESNETISKHEGFYEDHALEERVNYYGNYRVCVSSSVYGPFFLPPSLVPILSHLNPKISIQIDKWAVTVIDVGVSAPLNPLTWGGHAVIICEGIKFDDKEKKVRYFMKRADFGGATGSCGNALVRLFEIPPIELKYKIKHKSRTFLIKKELVEKMIKKIEEQIEEQNTSFNIIFKNCLVWAEEMIDLVGLQIPKLMRVQTPKTTVEGIYKREKWLYDPNSDSEVDQEQTNNKITTHFTLSAPSNVYQVRKRTKSTKTRIPLK